MTETIPSALHFDEVQGAFASGQVVDFISDLHLQASEPETYLAFLDYLGSTPAHAIFILGDLFEAWVGDDCLDEPGSFETQACALLHAAAMQRRLYFMHGNRDFLAAERFAQATRMTLLGDPAIITLGAQRCVLSHGDILCLDDVQYQQFRQISRTRAWQQQVLQQPLAVRRQIAQGARAQSEAQKRAAPETYADLDLPATLQWLQQAGSALMIHGHTHKPAEHDLGEGRQRIVLCDWDLQATPPRAQALRWQEGAFRRINLA